jgi:glycosyltransferase involved in cell wall biosynthesis
MKTVVVFEFYQGGHRSEYLNIISRTLLDLGCRVVACCPNPDEIKPFGKTAIPQGRFLTIKYELPDTSKTFGGTFGTGLKRWWHLSVFVSSLKNAVGFRPDFVFFNFSDSLNLSFPGNVLVDMFFTWKWGGLFVQPCRILNEKPRTIWSRIYFALNPFSVFNARKCAMFAILNEMIFNEISKRVVKSKIRVFPDFADSRLPSKDSCRIAELRQKAGGRTIVGLFGYLKKYKGILTLLEVAKRCAHDPIFFLFAGEPSTDTFTKDEYDGIMSFAASTPDNCMFVFEYIPDEREYNAFVNKSDIIAAAFEDFPYSSNTIAKAAVFKKPLIVSDGYCMAKRVKEYSLGMIIEQRNVEQMMDAINKIRQNYKKITSEARFGEYAEKHSTDRLKPLFAQTLHINPGKDE